MKGTLLSYFLIFLIDLPVLHEALEDLDDVQHVYHNLKIAERQGVTVSEWIGVGGATLGEPQPIQQAPEKAASAEAPGSVIVKALPLERVSLPRAGI